MKNNEMKSGFNKTDYLLWLAITGYTGVIYATLSVVSALRKILTEKYGYGIFDQIYWIFGVIGAGLCWHIFRRFRGAALAKALAVLLAIASVYLYYLLNLRYAVERIHFLEYGFLGALVLIAVNRHCPALPSFISAACITYWLGMGDEYIQFLLPGRVGEIRDSVLNAISGVLGMALIINLDARPAGMSRPLKPGQLVFVFTILGLTTLFTALFIIAVHGFGYRHESKDPGIVFSSLSLDELSSINAGKALPERKMKQYRDEAVRHLLQREYYCINDFMAGDGSFYRRWDKCFMENRVLEAYYSLFLREKAQMDAGQLINEYDRKLAAEVRGNKVLWTPERRQSLEGSGKSAGIYKSRVKSTVITGFQFRDLVFYTLLILLVLAWTGKKLSSTSPESYKK
ncbi:VanZ family protein [Fibrobacterota bacterium]